MLNLITKIKAFSHTIETQIEANLYHRLQEYTTVLQKNKNQPKAWDGRYTVEGANRFFQMHPNVNYKTFLSQPSQRVSSVGVGTYKGSLDQTDDLPMFNAIIDSILCGCNVIDTCRNFRKGRSEIVVGQALRYLFENEGYYRDNFFISSKAGYVFQELISGVTSADVINDHCVHPKFIASQLQKSLKSLGLNTIDIYYLNNFAESQMQSLGKKQFDDKLAAAFQALESARAKGKIQFYGLSSWQSFRLPQGKPGYLSLETIQRIAQKVGGKTNGFKFIQTPINIMMPQTFADKYKDEQSFLDTAEKYGINVISNSPLLSGTLINIPMPASLLKCNNNGAKHLQLIRSIPSKALVCTLVGHKLNRHVRKNLEVLTSPILDEGQWLNVFVPKSQPNPIQA